MERSVLDWEKKIALFFFQLRALTMKMQRWNTRWKTKRWLWDSTLTVAVIVILILQVVTVRAGKKLTPSDHLSDSLAVGPSDRQSEPAINFIDTQTQFATRLRYLLQTLSAGAADMCMLKDTAAIKV